MKRLVIFREDDVNYFTDPRRIAAIHSPVLSRGLPIAISVIPRVIPRCPLSLGTANLFHQCFGLRHEPFIPPSNRGLPGRFDVCANKELVRFLRQAPVEVLQHGYEHVWEDKPECEMTELATLAQRLARGRAILEEAVGKAPEFFVPPWHRLSPPALRILRRLGFKGVSLERGARELLRRAWPGCAGRQRHQRRRRWKGAVWGNGMLVLEHHGCIDMLFARPAETMALFRRALETSEVLVLVSHHFEFDFDGRGSPDPKRLRLWHRMQELVLARKDTRVVTFQEAHSILRQAGRRYG